MTSNATTGGPLGLDPETLVRDVAVDHPLPDLLASDRELAAAFAQSAFGRDVLIYVHGYRESFQSAALSAAKLSDGIRFRGASALFTWPSAAATFDYGYDRESALWSRDAFEDLLKALAASPSGGRINIVAHSMGTLLTLETLRMLRAEAGEAAMARIGAVVLAAPDIDIDLFAKGVERLGPDVSKITVISSTNDRALELSSTIAGGIVRAGAADRGRLEALGVRVAMDDFGTGYSSMSYLRTFPFDQIKLDRSFITGLSSNREARAIVRARPLASTGDLADVVARAVGDAGLKFSVMAMCRKGSSMTSDQWQTILGGIRIEGLTAGKMK